MDHVRKLVYIRPDQDRAIRLAAADRGVDQSEIVREALDQYVQDAQVKKAPSS